MVEAGYVRTSASPRSAPRRSAAPTRCTRSADLQIEYSLISRGIEDEILPTCRELGIGVTAYGVLSRGLLSGHWSKDARLAPGDFRSHAPALRAARTSTATSRSSRRCARSPRRRGRPSPRSRSPGCSRAATDIVPLVGARRRDRLAEALGALDLDLAADDLARIEAAVPPGRRGRRPLRRAADGDPRQRADLVSDSNGGSPDLRPGARCRRRRHLGQCKARGERPHWPGRHAPGANSTLVSYQERDMRAGQDGLRLEAGIGDQSS